MDKLLIALFVTCTTFGFAQRHDFRANFKAMGSAFEVVVVAQKDSAQWANAMIDSAKNEIFRIEKEISSWDKNSETSAVNAAAGKSPVFVSPELYNLVSRCLLLSKITDGAFDITYAGMADLWDFSPENRELWPDSSSVIAANKRVNYTLVDLSINNAISLKMPGMRIGFGGIGKGFAADEAAKKLQKLGVKNGVINASGDLYCWGKDEKNEPWKVAVVSPVDKSIVKLYLSAENQAVVTSGDYEKYKLKNGVRYAHIINPVTGFPVSGIMSATVIAPKAELADALATSIFVLGKEDGLALINQLNNVECIIIDENEKLWYSKNVETLRY